MTQATFDNAENRARIESRIKLGRAARADDIRGAAICLASDAAALVTGSAHMVGGG
ncbi:SDR family oxidoreductase [Brevirhabdus sp.]|uniref:SDR family oxidoreductase n=1 Tax=Brevirhabdus sp. TaxID=2004514 RepID=UPI00405A4736